MSFLLDMDICSAYLKNDPRIFTQIYAPLRRTALSAIIVGELFVWAKRRGAAERESSVRDLLKSCTVLDADVEIGERFGLVRADLLDRGIVVGELDLLIAATALVHNLTLVTHNTTDYRNIPNLRLADRRVP